MKFYSDIEGNAYIWDGKKVVPFVDGVIETKDSNLIDILTKAGYRKGGTDGEAKQGNAKGQEAETEPKAETETDWESCTKQEITKELFRRGIEFNKRDNKSILIALLEGE